MDLEKIGVEAVAQAATFCAKIQNNLEAYGSIDKKDRSPVTVADFGSQAIISHFLQKHTPDIPLMAEESSDELKKSPETVNRLSSLLDFDPLPAIERCTHAPDSDRYWVLDPIDGTKGFLRNAHYAVALALIDKGRPVLGILSCPRLEGASLIAAQHKGGVRKYTNSTAESLSLPEKVPLSAARTCESVESQHSDHSVSGRICHQLGITHDPYRMDSQAKYAALALGFAQIYLRLPTKKDYREKVWDHAAGALILEELGGHVTDVAGQHLDYTHGSKLMKNRGVIATIGVAHDKVVSAYQQQVSS